MISILAIAFAVLCLWIVIYRYKIQEQKHERLLLRRLASSYLELHKRT